MYLKKYRRIFGIKGAMYSLNAWLNRNMIRLFYFNIIFHRNFDINIKERPIRVNVVYGLWLPYRTRCPIGRDFCFVFMNRTLFLFFFSYKYACVWSEISLFVSLHWRNHQHQPHMFLQTSSHSDDHYFYSFLFVMLKKKRRKTKDYR